MSLLCLFPPKVCFGAVVRKSNLFSAQLCRSIAYKIQSQRSKLSARPRTIMETVDIDAKLIDPVKLQLLQIFDAGVSSVLPAALIENKVHLVDSDLVINDESYPIKDDVYLVGFGKAVAGMAYVLEQLLGSRLKRGIISVPRASTCSIVESPGFECLRELTKNHCQNLQALKSSSVIEYREAAENNQPDEASLENTEKIVELVEGLAESDTLIVLISGGGSALLSQPKAPVTTDTKRDLCKKLQNAGACIKELNCVRKQLSMVKGGGLAKIAYPANVIALVLSDIVGDPLDFIASGPTCPILLCEDEGITEQEAAINILRKYNLYKNLDVNVKRLLTEPEEVALNDKSMVEDGTFKHVTNIIIGNNTTALEAASEFSKKFDLESIVLSNLVEGDVKDVSCSYAKLTRFICHILEKNFPTKEEFLEEIPKRKLDALKINEEKFAEAYEILKDSRKDKGILLLAGGEPTVVVEGCGRGGRNQELALRFSLDWLGEIARDPVLARYFVLFLSAGTDGQDGPTDATGAFGHPGFRPKLAVVQKELLEKQKFTLKPDELDDIQCKLCCIEQTLPENALKDNNSYHFYSNFEEGRYLVKTGLTGTNVMDLHFIYLKKRSCQCDILTFFGKNETEKKPKKKFGDCP